ncbi:MAG: hypothetical protein RJA49_1668 [Actinomycetota bacterium]|jgi:hypothetical protein
MMIACVALTFSRVVGLLLLAFNTGWLLARRQTR